MVKTDELIDILARDAAPVKAHALPRRLSTRALVGALAALVVMTPAIGFRPDFPAALSEPSFWMKGAYTSGLAASGFLLAERFSRPGADSRLGWVVAVVCVGVIAALAVTQLVIMQSADRTAAILGGSWNSCPWLIFGFALPGLAAILLAMRRFAPTHAALAGAAAGLLAGGVAATIYGLHCDESTAPFVALWYTLGIALTALTGAIAGTRILRW